MYEFRSSRYRLYPNRAQAEQFRQLCGASRYVYNTLLDEQIQGYERYRAGDGEKPDASAYGLGRQFIRLRHRDGHDWLERLSCRVVRASGAFRLGAAFGHLFRRVKEARAGEEPGFPRFKAKGISRESFIIPEAVRLERKRLRVPKVGGVRLNRKAQSRSRGADPWSEGEVVSAVVYEELGKWYAAVLWRVEIGLGAWPWNARAVGIDRNSENVALFWEGETRLIEVPLERIERYEKKAAHYQWRASRRKMKPLRDEDGAPVLKKSGRPVRVASGRRQKMQRRAAKAKRRAATIRLDWSHQTACRIARQFQFIVLEDLNLKAMTKSAKGTRECPGKQVGAKSALNRKLLRSCMGQLGRFLEYKAMKVLKVPARNTSRKCARCGHTEEANRKAERFACRACGHRDHADCNAARNILGLGLSKLLAGGAPVTGRGGDNETGVLLCEWRHLVETANDPSRHLSWNLPRLDPG